LYLASNLQNLKSTVKRTQPTGRANSSLCRDLLYLHLMDACRYTAVDHTSSHLKLVPMNTIANDV